MSQPSSLTAWLEENGILELEQTLQEQGFKTVMSIVESNLTDADLRSLGIEQMKVRKDVLRALAKLGAAGDAPMLNLKPDEHYVVDDVRKMGEVCSCADCAKMKDSGPGWRVEVGWGEYWHEQKYGRLRDESGNIVGDNEYWAPDFEMVMNENVNYYATKLYALDDVCVKHEAFQESSTSGAGPSASGAGPSSRGAGRPSNDRPQKRQRTTFNI